MEEIRAEVLLTRAEYVRGVRLYLRKSGIVGWFSLVLLALMAAATGVLIWLLGMTLVNTGLVVLLVMAVAIGVFLYFIQPGRTFDRAPQLGESTVYTFSAENIGVRGDSVVGVVEWRFQRFWSTEEFYVLFQGKNQYTIFPKRCFPGEEAQTAFERLVKTSVPDIISRYYR